MRPRTFAIVVVALLILASGGVVWSQTVQGVITGTIMDPTGAVVPNVTVTITNVGTNISQATTTGSDGSYRFALVPPGTYTVDVKATNFAEVRTTGIVVEASQIVPFNVKLELAKASQVIEVTAGPAQSLLISHTKWTAPPSSTLRLSTVTFSAFSPLRSEEHTSELQSRLHLVCRLLLEKKKNELTRTYGMKTTRHNLRVQSPTGRSLRCLC